MIFRAPSTRNLENKERKKEEQCTPTAAIAPGQKAPRARGDSGPCWRRCGPLLFSESPPVRSSVPRALQLISEESVSAT